MPMSKKRPTKKSRGPKRGPRRGPSAVVTLVGNISVTLGTTNLQTNVISSSVWSASRFSAYSAAFQNVKILSISVQPINLTASSYLEYALLPAHSPALLSSFDATPANPVSTSNVASLPGARFVQQGNGSIKPCKLRLRVPQFMCSRVSTDVPPIAYLVAYGSNNTNFNVFVKALFTGYTTLY